uniref:RNA helicase n=1 Tax=Glossina brevipalpis TaxID=37001 RepID=A0A1A9WF90_9MUSC
MEVNVNNHDNNNDNNSDNNADSDIESADGNDVSQDAQISSEKHENEKDDKKSVEPVKSSNQILTELFKVFNVAPPDELLDDKNLINKVKKHKKEKKKKHNKKKSPLTNSPIQNLEFLRENNMDYNAEKKSNESNQLNLNFLHTICPTEDFLLASDSQSLLGEDPLLFTVEQDVLQPVSSKFLVPGIYKRIAEVDELSKRQAFEPSCTVFISELESQGRIIKRQDFHDLYVLADECGEPPPRKVLLLQSMEPDCSDDLEVVDPQKEFRHWDALSHFAYDKLKLTNHDLIVIDRKRNEVVRTERNTGQKIIYRFLDPRAMGLQKSEKHRENHAAVNSTSDLDSWESNRAVTEKNSNKRKMKAGRPPKHLQTVVRKQVQKAQPTVQKAQPTVKPANFELRTRSGRLVKSPGETIDWAKETSLNTSSDFNTFLNELRDGNYRASNARQTKDPILATPTTDIEAEATPKRKVPPEAICPTCHKIFLGRRLQKHFAQHPDHMKIPNTNNMNGSSPTEDSTLFRFLITKLQKSQHLNEDQKADLFLNELNDFVEQLQLRSSRLIRNTSGMHFVNNRCSRILGIPEGQYALDLTAMEDFETPQLLHYEHSNPPALPSGPSHVNTRSLDYTNLSITMDETLTDEAAQKLNLSAGGKLLPPSEESLLRAVDDLVHTDINKIHASNLLQPTVVRAKTTSVKSATVVANLLPPHIDHVSDNAVEAVNLQRNTQDTIAPFWSKESFYKSVKSYLENTTLHGLQYLAEDKITITERVFFGLSFVLVVALSSFFISNIYGKWSASPIIITLSAKHTMDTDIPFPAITICNLNQARKSRVQSIARSSSNFSLLLSLCNQASNDANVSSGGTWKDFKAILTEVAQPCNEMLVHCSFGSRIENCSRIFRTILTDDGLCCTFNALDPKYLLKNYSEDNLLTSVKDDEYTAINWTPDEGYDKNLPKKFSPRTSGGIGKNMGLTVIINASTEEYYCSKSNSAGFKFLVHNPANLPKVSNYGSLLAAGREAFIPIYPIYEDAGPRIRSHKQKIRRCLFSDEGNLTYYRSYSRENCRYECEARLLQKICSCILYYLPRSDPTIPICGPNDNVCTNHLLMRIESTSDSLACNDCLPGCFELTYRINLSTSPIMAGTFGNPNGYPEGVFNNATGIRDISTLHFFYTTNRLRSTTKSEIIGFTEFLSNTGGILSLFMGFSIFSVIEIFYYITLKPYCAVRTNKKKRLAWQKDIKIDVNRSNRAINSMSKIIRAGLVEPQMDLEVLRKDTNSPLYSVKTFEQMPLKAEILKGIYDMGFNRPSKIQETVLPFLLADPPQNIIAQSQSGTGKTAAFVITMLSRVDTKLMHPQVICLSPTYELAVQTGEVAAKIARFYPDIKLKYAVRGESVEDGNKVVEHVIFGTPGKVLDWGLRSCVIDLEKIRVFVLDEADIMIAVQGHYDKCIRIRKKLLGNCQMLFFSATYEDDVMDFAKYIVPKVNIIRLRREEELLDNIKQYYVRCRSAQEKYEAIQNIYGSITIGQTIVFCHTRRTAEWLTNRMTLDGHAVALLSGDLSVDERLEMLDRFRMGLEMVLITTNVLSRGIDVEQVTLVVNFDLPMTTTGEVDCETYLHRIGRAGRFGRNGIAINLIDCDKAMVHCRAIECHFKRNIKELIVDDTEEIAKIGD